MRYGKAEICTLYCFVRRRLAGCSHGLKVRAEGPSRPRARRRPPSRTPPVRSFTPFTLLLPNTNSD